MHNSHGFKIDQRHVSVIEINILCFSECFKLCVLVNSRWSHEREYTDRRCRCFKQAVVFFLS